MARTRTSERRPSGRTAPVPVTPKGVATRAFILQTAAEAFAERGYADTTMSELIARSGLTKGAFYFHFASKEQLAFAVLEEKQRRWLERVREQVLALPTAIEQLRALGAAMLRLHRDDPSAYSASRLSRDLSRMPELADRIRAQEREWIELVADIVSRAQADGSLPGHLDAHAFAAVLVAATDGLKELSEIVDQPGRARRGFERRMETLIAIVETLITPGSHG
jgi:AcrR family transcriptional regulator